MAHVVDAGLFRVFGIFFTTRRSTKLRFGIQKIPNSSEYPRPHSFRLFRMASSIAERLKCNRGNQRKKGKKRFIFRLVRWIHMDYGDLRKRSTSFYDGAKLSGIEL